MTFDQQTLLVIIFLNVQTRIGISFPPPERSWNFGLLSDKHKTIGVISFHLSFLLYSGYVAALVSGEYIFKHTQ